tara:strand:+ start:97983 stop:98720 length:738 start_codon:yes stop_codon:yes gene_type:complete
MFESSNPALNENTFSRLERSAAANKMTIGGSAIKTLILLTLVCLSGSFSWQYMLQNPEKAYGMLMGGVITGLVLAMVIIFKQTLAPMLSPLYALAQGFVLGGLSASMEVMYPGIVVQAITLTLATLLAMLSLYGMRIIQATAKFRAALLAATGGIFLVYIASFILGFFGVSVPFIHSATPIGIGFSLIVVGIAALNLVLDFDLIERGARAGAPKYMEWYGAFALMVTLIWLYIEILRLLSKLRSR